MAKDQLINVFQTLGFSEVETFLASGNVIFGDGPEITERALSDALEHALGFEVPTTVRNPDELESVAGVDPFLPEAMGDAVGAPQVILLFDELTESRAQAVLDRSCADDLLVPASTAVYWLPAKGVSGTGLGPNEIERLVGQNTVRSANTIRRIVAKL